jgi:hypothetical protein
MEILLPEIEDPQVCIRMALLFKRANELAIALNKAIQEVPSFIRRFRDFENQY